MKLFGISNEEPLEELDEIIEEEETIQEDDIGQLSLDILETEHEIILLAPIAGVDLDQIDISYSQGVLVIKGNRQKPDIFTGNVEMRNSECFWGDFVRNVLLPDNLDFDNIQASMENNLLIITIQKLQFNSQSIKINRTL
jgi:HSP20 family protein|tara:strand:+ start:357 stop:776 length:420 start_codon:yes stop_codon:yes gene_type:complete